MRCMWGGQCCSAPPVRQRVSLLAAPSVHRPHPPACTTPSSTTHPSPWPSHTWQGRNQPRQVMCLAEDPSGPPGPSSPAPITSSSSSSAEPSYSYLDPINRALSNLLPPARDAAAELAHIDWQADKLRGQSLEALAATVEAKLMASEWFVTGNVDPALFSPDFVFRDENVATAGVQSYALGVRKLFDQATARAQVISVTADPSQRTLLVSWRLEGCVNLPLRPRIPPYIVNTTLAVDAEGLICSQLDEFAVPGWKLLAGALLGAWAGPEPAPPVEQLRAAAGKGRQQRSATSRSNRAQ